jgi:hypothetical protein
METPADAPPPEPEKCSICWEALDGARATTALEPCGHQFHVDCALGWFRSASNATSCPACRGQPDVHVTGWDLDDRCKVVMRRLRNKRFRDAYPQLERIACDVRKTRIRSDTSRREFSEAARAHRDVIAKCRRLRAKHWRAKLANRRARRTLGLASLPMLLEAPVRMTRRREQREEPTEGPVNHGGSGGEEEEEEEEEEGITDVVITLGDSEFAEDGDEISSLVEVL